MAYNEGLCAYLCDAANEEEITRIVEESDDDFPNEYSNRARGLRPLAERGLMVTYELAQDDELSLQVYVGEPATPEERREVPVLRPLVGYLALPSGRLRVHSPSTAPWGDPSEEDEPATVEVPPGEYVVTIHHLDFDRFQALHTEESELVLAAQFVFLTPVVGERPKRTSVFLRYPG